VTGEPKGAGWTAHPLAVVLLTLTLTLVVLVAVLPNLWYGLHDISDIPVYQAYADQIAQGLTAYLDFDIEYPPLAVPLFRVAGSGLTIELFMRRFSIAMGVLTMATGVVVALTACALWPRGPRAFVAGALYALSVALMGSIIVNRYDVAVALVVAAFLLCLVRRWYTAAAIVLGVGFALKITPLALLPLVLMLAGHPRRWLWPLVGFTGAAVAGFMPYLVVAPQGIWHVFRYHIERPLQIESVLGTPMLAGSALGRWWVEIGHSHGSHQLVATGADLAADLSGVFTFGALVIVYAVLLVRRAHLRATPEQLPLAVLALLLALMTFGKVLSPQYFIWVLPVLALAAVREPLVGLLGALVLGLTHAEFPSLYWNLVDLQPGVLALVSARNLLLVALFCLTLWRLAVAHPRPARAELPPGSPAGRGTPASPAPAAPAPSKPA
jgi:hypothetical protein